MHYYQKNDAENGKQSKGRRIKHRNPEFYRQTFHLFQQTKKNNNNKQSLTVFADLSYQFSCAFLVRTKKN